MADRIVIAHAYKGFTYLPLFLAHDLGYLPQGVELVYADGDEIAMQSVLNIRNVSNVTSDFAICDPLLIADLKQFIAKRESGRIHRPVVIGSLINHTPLWLFNTNPSIHPAADEEGLRTWITKIRSYSRPNTGYIIGRRLLDKLKLPNDAAHLKEVDFDHEFDDPVENNEVVVTSDILKMGEVGFNNHNIVFSYASKPTEVQDMFFTGVITREDLFAKDLPLVLAVLAGLKKAIHRINNDPVSLIAPLAFEAFKKKMAEYNFSPFVTKDEAKQRQIVTGAIEFIQNEELYSPTLEVRKEGWDKSISVRRPHIDKWVDPDYEAFTREIPVILIRSDWQDHISLRKDVRAQQLSGLAPTTVPALQAERLMWYQHITGTGGFILNVLLLIASFRWIANGLLQKPGPDALQNRSLAVLAIIFLFAGFTAFVYLCRRLWKRDPKDYSNYVTWWITLVLAGSGLAFVLK